MANVSHLNPVRRNNIAVQQALSQAANEAGREADGIIIIIAFGNGTRVIRSGTLESVDKASYHVTRLSHALLHK